MKWKRLCGMALSLATIISLLLPVYASSEPVELSIEVDNIVEGDIPPLAENFTFILEAVNGAPMPESNTLTISGTDTGRFQPITYTKPETYHYTLHEVIGSSQGYSYDNRIYDVTVQVVTDETGMLYVSMYVNEQGSEFKSKTIKFVNNYEVATVKNPQESKKPANITTGDNTNLMFWSALSSITLLILIGQVVLLRKDKHRADSSL